MNSKTIMMIVISIFILTGIYYLIKGIDNENIKKNSDDAILKKVEKVEKA